MSGILVVRLGAMGDILHALPAVASLRKSFPSETIHWLVARRWMPLLEDNPAIDNLVPFERLSLAELQGSWSRLRLLHPAQAFDFQGLLQSALAGWLARPRDYWGFARHIVREPLASFFYRHKVQAAGPHRIDQNLQLVAAAGATELTVSSWIPPGTAEGTLPPGPFVLANPFAGWKSKEWPLANYAALGRLLRLEGLTLVLNVPAARTAELQPLENIHVHTSNLPGLIYATRQALAVVGLDSGPLHLAAALQKPGVAIFGPTNPLTHGPYGGTIRVLRATGVESTYKRGREIHSSMHAVSPEHVYRTLATCLRELELKVGLAQ